jgi:coenzyme F420-0:L-glutamate ligase/coenzyme F420-1:gamma-L-glutamate ligase
MTLQIFALDGIREVVPGDDLAALILEAADGRLRDGDILAVTSKIVSKAEDRFVRADDREQAITDETVRVVASRETPGGTVRIVENRLGIIAAAAGVDSSSVPVGTVLLLPEDPDHSAARIVDAIRERVGIRVGVLVTDTLGRAWRIGQTDAAIGVAGMDAVRDLRGTVDEHGQEMSVTIAAVADEIAGAADLVKGKAQGLPVAVVRGLSDLVHTDERAAASAGTGEAAGAAGAAGAGEARGAAALLRPQAEDMFHTGAAESRAQGYAEGHAAGCATGFDDGYAAALRDHGITP